MSSISVSILSSLVMLIWFSGFGKALKSGGKTKGFFFITKNSSLDSYFFPDKASLTDWHEYKEIKRIIKSKFLNISFNFKNKFM